MPGHDQQGIPEPIWLVGRGPVGERWVTVEGLEMVSRAQVLVHEAPAEPWLAGRAHPGTLHLEGVLVEMIDRILEETVQGRCVVCLCTGDPLLDQGGLALAQALQAAGRAYRIIPGITEIQKQAVAVGLPLAEALKSGGLLLEPARVVSSEHPSRGGRSTILWGEA
ncbi:MAG: SAM-dependent methyltransferase, partial [Acidobacteriota bacterium]